MSFVSYAQNFEDVMLWRALKHVQKGFYIDVGAQDPVIDSVSLAFYERGWRGAHVEPTAQYASKLRIARPDETVMQVAVGSGSGPLTFFEFKDTGLSTADATIAAEHKAKGFECMETQTPLVSLDTVLARHADRPVHWLKVDVEGMEESVLGSWRESGVRPWILVIESTRPSTEALTHGDWERLIVAKGYEFAYFDGLNRFYVSSDHLDLKAALSHPPNVFDDFLLSGQSSHPFYKHVEEKMRHASLAERQALQAEIQSLRANLQGVLNSRSWRATAPLRWAVMQARTMRREGPVARFRAMQNRLLRASVSFIDEHRGLRVRLTRYAHSLGLYTPVRSLYRRLKSRAYNEASREGGHNATRGPEELTAHAQRIRRRLVHANKSRDGA